MAAEEAMHRQIGLGLGLQWELKDLQQEGQDHPCGWGTVLHKAVIQSAFDFSNVERATFWTLNAEARL